MRKLSLVLCLTSLALTLFLAALDIVIVITLYETIGEKFKDYARIGWLVTGYALPNALFTLLWGRLASILGLKTSLTFSIVIFEIGSLIVAVSNSMGMIIGGRVVAGCGGSGIQSLVFVVGTSLVEERNRGMVITVLGLAFAVAFAVGPVIGGAFTENVSWRWCFYINLPIGGVALTMLTFSYNTTEKSVQETLTYNCRQLQTYRYGQWVTASFWRRAYNFLMFDLDFIGFALSSTGFVLFMLGLTFGGNTYAWNSGTIISFLTVGAILVLFWLVFDFVLLYKWAAWCRKREATPLLRRSLCFRPGIFTSSIANLFTCFGFNMQTVYIVQLYQLVFNSGPTAASMHLWAFLIATMVSVIIIGKAAAIFGLIKPAIVFGATCGLVGSGLMTLVRNTSTTGNVIGYCILPGAAFGSIMQGTLLSAQVQVDHDDENFQTMFIEATALNTFVKSLGFSFGGVVATMIFTNSVKNQLRSTSAGVAAFSSVEALIAYRGQNYDGPGSTLSLMFVKAIKDVMYAALGCYGIVFIASLFTSNRRLRLPSKNDGVEATAQEKSISGGDKSQLAPQSTSENDEN
ncbi:KLTH0C10142p [Lachancea thermotolerans CBS 6340]|uniref:KLTH0C10142p n=1 Tax=Lachancea thermotolerans (strain ATCC 56472 / CBS 6340 / NRRL Y-8284) TaxID=559295 RepID=C5DEL1_LACTC|nr:KLTH0C10142p [Lachancea thermotolerans CBS 6340]CAR22222.1 KLTH0C10142p [Lachancea thermotolerans CBS 6340]